MRYDLLDNTENTYYRKWLLNKYNRGPMLDPKAAGNLGPNRRQSSWGRQGQDKISIVFVRYEKLSYVNLSSFEGSVISRQGSGLSGRHGAMSPAHTPGFNSTNDVHGLNSQGSLGSVGSRIDGTGPIRRIIRDIKTELKVAIFDMAQKPKHVIQKGMQN